MDDHLPLIPGKTSASLWRSEVEKLDNPFQYAGEYLDQETGLYYLRARYYDPQIQRFISEDSLSKNPYWQQHVYAYCGYNPVNYIDPTGHLAQGEILQYGSTGNDVTKAQTKLQELGLYKGKIDGIFGKQTLAAVNSFKDQKELGNSGEYYGKVGAQTWSYLGLTVSTNSNNEQQKEVNRSINTTNNIVESKVQNNNKGIMNKLEQGIKSGGSALLNDYGVGNAIKDTGLVKANALRSATQSHDPLIKVNSTFGKVIVKRAIPVVNWGFFINDLVTFGKGFWEGWNE